MLKGNIGEWGEFYAFLKILSDKKISAADASLNPIPDKYIDVLKVTRQEKKSELKTYDISGDKSIEIACGAEVLTPVSYSGLKNSVAAVFKAMQENSLTTFSVPAVEPIAEALHCSGLDAGSSHKADLLLVIHDRITPTDVLLGFSIKSMMGEPATLLNAGTGTNFVYNVVSEDSPDPEDINKIKTKSSIRDRVEAIDSHSGKLSFKNIQSERFTASLRMIDILLPEILAEMVKSFYSNKGRKVQELVEATDFSGISVPKDFVLTPEVCRYKIKQFLAAIALGMTPEKRWDGLASAQGGYIIVKEDGELVCYHLYHRDQFEEYLYLNTKFETASTTRHGFGLVYRDGEENLLKLNLQVRFIR